MDNKEESHQELSKRLEKEMMEYIEKDAIKVRNVFGSVCNHFKDGCILREMIISDIEDNDVAMVSFLGVDSCNYEFMHYAFGDLLYMISKRDFGKKVVIIGMSDDMHEKLQNAIDNAERRLSSPKGVPIIDVGREFHAELTRRDHNHKGYGLPEYSAVIFREKYLGGLMSPKPWKEVNKHITLDFSNVEILGAAFANEAFAYFTQYASPEHVLLVIDFRGLGRVKESTIRVELDKGYFYSKERVDERKV